MTPLSVKEGQQPGKGHKQIHIWSRGGERRWREVYLTILHLQTKKPSMQLPCRAQPSPAYASAAATHCCSPVTAELGGLLREGRQCNWDPASIVPGGGSHHPLELPTSGATPSKASEYQQVPSRDVPPAGTPSSTFLHQPENLSGRSWHLSPRSGGMARDCIHISRAEREFISHSCWFNTHFCAAERKPPHQKRLVQRGWIPPSAVHKQLSHLRIRVIKPGGRILFRCCLCDSLQTFPLLAQPMLFVLLCNQGKQYANEQQRALPRRHL